MPMPNGSGPNRRQFLQRAAILAAAAPTLGSFLAACSKSEQSSSSAPTLTIAAPDHPVKWDIPADNKPIADGLAPEKDATLPACLCRRMRGSPAGGDFGCAGVIVCRVR